MNASGKRISNHKPPVTGLFSRQESMPTLKFQGLRVCVCGVGGGCFPATLQFWWTIF